MSKVTTITAPADRKVERLIGRTFRVVTADFNGRGRIVSIVDGVAVVELVNG